MAAMAAAAPPGAAQGSDEGMLQFERRAWARGSAGVAGIDEAGRGPLAGPLVVAAVILPRQVPLPPVRDSKQLTPARRAVLDAALRALPGLAFATVVVSPAEIDRRNILEATRAAMREAATRLLPAADYALIDGLPVPGFPLPSEAIVGGDARSASIAAASILAKVLRDGLMVEADRRWPGYGFARHKGYGTAAHLEALRRLGPCPEHRRSFAPVAAAAAGTPVQLEWDMLREG
jgi:ribonuclease HII